VAQLLTQLSVLLFIRERQQPDALRLLRATLRSSFISMVLSDGAPCPIPDTPTMKIEGIA